jgi:protein gp37
MSKLTPTDIPYLDAVWNPITGCSPAGDGCRNCYAARLAATRLCRQPKYAGLAFRQDITAWNPDSDPMLHQETCYPWTGEVRFHADLLDAPLHARKPRVIGVCFMGDLFHPKVTDEQIVAVFDVMRQVWNWTLEGREPHRFLLLTKRPERMRDFCLRLRCDIQRGTYLGDTADSRGYPLMPHRGSSGLPNVILGTSVWNQESADRNIPHLLATPAACRVASVEPMLGACRLDRLCYHGKPGTYYMDALRGRHSIVIDGEEMDPDDQLPKLDGIILGGESGPGARPMRPEWALDVWRQCRAAGVPFYWKQGGKAFDSQGTDGLPFGDVADYWAMQDTHELPEAMRL